MRYSALSGFWGSIKPKSLVVALLFIVANMVSTLSVFVPSASAALVWEDIAVTHNTDNTPLTNSILPKGSGLLFHTVSTANLNSYTSYKLSFNYTNLNVGATNVDLYYQEQTKLGAGVGSFVKYASAYPISATSGYVEAAFSVAVASDNKLRLDIVNEDNNPWNDDNTFNPADYPNRLNITNIRLQGQKDDGTVAVPAAPTLTSPANGASVHYDAIHNSTAKIVFTPATGVQTNHVEVSGLFKNASDVEEHYTYNGASPGELEYATAGSSGHDFIVGETYSWRVRSSFESIPVSDASNSAWGAWSELRTFTVINDSAPQLPAAPTLVSPVNDAQVGYSQIGSTSLRYTHASGTVKHWISVTGTFRDDDNWGDYYDMTRDIISTTGNISLSDIEALDGGRYEFVGDGSAYTWKVRSSFVDADLSDEDSWGEWSTKRDFTVIDDDYMLATPTLSSPANGSSVGTLTPVLTWSASAGMPNYVLQVAEDSSFDKYRSQAGTNKTSIALLETAGLQDGKTYYWRVKAHNSTDLTESFWSEAWSFTVKLDKTIGNGGNTADDTGYGGGGEMPKITSMSGTDEGAYFAIADLEVEGEVLADQDSNEVLQDTPAIDGQQTEEGVAEASDDSGDDTPFLFLGWWWLPLLIAAGGGAYYLFRTPSED